MKLPKSKQTTHDFIIWAALPMARTAQVESRLQIILKPNANRRALTQRAVIGSLVAAALGVGALAAFKPEARAQNDAAATPTSWKQTLPSGATVELVGISDVPPYQEGWWRKDDPPPRRGWWQPNGTPLAHAPVDSDKQMTPVGTKNVEGWRQFAVRVSPPSGTTAGSRDTNFDLSQTSGLTNSSWQQASRGGRALPTAWLVGASFSDLQTPPVIRCGVADGPWETLTSQYVIPASGAMKSVSLMYQHRQVDVIFSRTSEISGNVAVTVTNTLPDTLATWRVLAVDTVGKVYSSSGGGRLGGKVQQETCVFAGLPRKRVRAFQFQARPFEWAEFQGIALMPGKK